MYGWQSWKKGLQFELIELNLGDGDQFKPEFLKLNI
jgi:glutathione S-transferase